MITRVSISRKAKRLIIEARNPQSIYIQLLKGLFPIDNNQHLLLKKHPHTGSIKIIDMGPFMLIEAPSISFKAEATDKAGNNAVETIDF